MQVCPQDSLGLLQLQIGRSLTRGKPDETRAVPSVCQPGANAALQASPVQDCYCIELAARRRPLSMVFFFVVARDQDTLRNPTKLLSSLTTPHKRRVVRARSRACVCVHCLRVCHFVRSVCYLILAWQVEVERSRWEVRFFPRPRFYMVPLLVLCALYIGLLGCPLIPIFAWLMCAEAHCHSGRRVSHAQRM